jgi:hypothetical protein
LRDLPDLILSSCEPSSLSDEQLEAVAGESEEVKEQRAKAIQTIAALESVLQTCRQYKGTSRSTPQKATPSRTGEPLQASTPAPKASTNHTPSSRVESSNGASKDEDEEISFKFDSPSTPRPARSGGEDEQPSPSPSSSLSSGLRSAKSNGSSTPLSSPTSSGYGQHYNNASGSVAYRSASRAGKK